MILFTMLFTALLASSPTTMKPFRRSHSEPPRSLSDESNSTATARPNSEIVEAARSESEPESQELFRLRKKINEILTQREQYFSTQLQQIEKLHAEKSKLKDKIELLMQRQKEQVHRRYMIAFLESEKNDFLKEMAETEAKQSAEMLKKRAD